MHNFQAMFLNLWDLYLFTAGKNIYKGISHLQPCVGGNPLGKVKQDRKNAGS